MYFKYVFQLLVFQLLHNTAISSPAAAANAFLTMWTSENKSGVNRVSYHTCLLAYVGLQ